MQSQRKPYFTPEEYLAGERDAAFKSEYYRGEIFAMAGASDDHNQIASNIIFAVRSRVAADKCRVVSGDMRVHIAAHNFYTYPDIVITCGERKFLDDKSDTLTNPLVLMEILSKSTEQYDRGQKFEFYRSIESLQEYVIVAQDRMSTELFRRHQDGFWAMYDAKDFLEIQSLGIEIPLKELYADIHF